MKNITWGSNKNSGSCVQEYTQDSHGDLCEEMVEIHAKKALKISYQNHEENIKDGLNTEEEE